MNPSHQQSRTELIQRLADGELPDAERRELLQKIDDETPERWRDVALCLLVNRLLAEGLRSGEATRATVPAQNVMPFPVWKRICSVAAALAVGLGLGFLVPRQQSGAGAPLFTSVDEFKKAVGEALMEGGSGGGTLAMLGGSDEPPDGEISPAGPQPGPFAEPEATVGGVLAPVDIGSPEPPSDMSAGGPQPGPVRPVPQPSGEDATEKADKLVEIEKHLADIRRLLDSMK